MLVKNSISLKLNSATTKNNPLIWKIIAKAMLSPAKTFFTVTGRILPYLINSKMKNTKTTTADKDIRTNVTEPCGLLASSALFTPKKKLPNYHDLQWIVQQTTMNH
jgi:hypothetical protein